jgi:hypothetical protein
MTRRPPRKVTCLEPVAPRPGAQHCHRVHLRSGPPLPGLPDFLSCLRAHGGLRPQTLPQGTVTAAGRGHILRATARRR